MENSKNATHAGPEIESVNPLSMMQNTEGKLLVFGKNFNQDSSLMIGGNFPKTILVSETQLQGELTARETGTVGEAKVQIHDLRTGSLSNAKILTITEAT